MREFGLIGKNIDYSFSKSFFQKKFTDEGINASYENCHLENVADFRTLLQQKKWSGFNVTIPYKEEIIPFLNEISDEAEKIGAVNTIEIKENRLIGHNTDHFGFLKSIFPKIENHHKKALVLGTGGAAKAVAFALDNLGIEHISVSRKPKKNQLNYTELDKNTMDAYKLIINCTPLGTFPEVNQSPDLPYELVSTSHFLYDLIYNPPLTQFLAFGKQRGAKLMNGQQMLIEQALQAWSIWNK